MAKRHSEETIEVNLTPFIDVVFTLILFFMLGLKFKILEGKIDTNLPKEKGIHSTPVKVKPQLYEINVYFKYESGATLIGYQNPRAIVSADELVERVVADLRTYKIADMPVKIRPDDNVPWEAIVQVINKLKKYKEVKIEFATSKTKL